MDNEASILRLLQELDRHGIKSTKDIKKDLQKLVNSDVENFVEALSLDIDSYGQSIYSYIERYSILYFTIIIFFNLAFCIPYFFYKNKDINKVRQMLMIIPKDILFKIIEQVNGKKEIEDEW